MTLDERLQLQNAESKLFTRSSASRTLKPRASRRSAHRAHLAGQLEILVAKISPSSFKSFALFRQIIYDILFSMASVKRKAVTDERPSKKLRPTQSDLHSKKAAKPDSKPPRTAKAEEGGERRPVKKSILVQEERAFPRGGASVLTPLEQKQVRLEADRDVLFEQSGRKPAGHADYGSAVNMEDAAAKQAPAKKKRKAKRSSFGEEPAKREGPKIQGLSYKNLAVGALVLGQVTGITTRDVALALPNNLTGYVPLTAVSERLNARIETLLAEEEKDGSQDGEDDEDIDLEKLFHVGQWLRASVISTSSASESVDHKSKRRIELSVDPQRGNAGLEEKDVVINSMLQASVRSVEDHGVIMDLGLANGSVKGFISKKELGSNYSLGKLQDGQVLLCLAASKSSNGKVINLSANETKFSCLATANHSAKEAKFVSSAPTVDAFLPGTAVEVLVTQAGAFGLSGKVMGMLDVTADVIHSGAGGRGQDIASKYTIGSKIRARVVCNFPGEETKKLGVSLLDHMLRFGSEQVTGKKAKTLALSSVVEDAKVIQVQSNRGLFLDLGAGQTGFAHISQLSDTRVDSLSSDSGSYKEGSVHRARIVSFNPMDGLYYVSLQSHVLEQTFLRIEDIEVGQDVKGTVERLILGAKGITGVLVKLADGITGLVPEMHLADVKLTHPEKKFREGFPVKARVLSVDLDKRHVRLTLKKSLLNPDIATWNSYVGLKAGDESPGTIVSLSAKGAAVQFFGPVRAWLPVAEMSDAYIERPEEHFRLGQTVKVHVVSVNAETQEMKVSSKDESDFGKDEQDTWEKITGGDFVTGTVTEKSAENVMLDLEESGLKAVIRSGHLADGSESKMESSLKRIRVGQKLTNLLVLDKLDRSRHILLTNKPTLVDAAKSGTLIRGFTDVKDGGKVHGFIRNITPEGVYIEYANATVGLLPKSQLSAEMSSLPAFGLRKDQSIASWVMSTDSVRERFVLSTREQQKAAATPDSSLEGVVNPVDGVSTALTDFSTGKRTKAEVVALKGTQLNVKLADNIQGRIDVSEVFGSWEEIKNKKQPLAKFQRGQVLEVKVLGMHDARNHRFLPITHRLGRVPVFELTTKIAQEEPLSLDKIAVGSAWTAFVNNHGDNCVWVNLSPNVRGRVNLMDLAEDVSLLQNLEKNFPVGSALRVKVKSMDANANRLDLTAMQHSESAPLTLQSLSKGMVLPGRVTKITERSVTVQLSDNIAGPVPLVEMADDFTQANPGNYSKNDIVRVCVLDTDLPNKRVYMSLRPSKVLSSSLHVKDPQITDISQLHTNDLIRGFVKHVADKGVYVGIGARFDAFVRISDLSDSFVKDWKSIYEIDQLVSGRILAIDVPSNHVLMSLKASHTDPSYIPPFSINDLEVGQVVTGKVRKVEDFGAFVDIDHTNPRLSGLCHRSEVATKRVEDVRKLYSEGDVVKAMVLSVDVGKRKISLGLKASYFRDVDEDEEEDEESDAEAGVELDGVTGDSEDEDELEDGGIDLDAVRDLASDDEAVASSADEMEVDDTAPVKPVNGLKTNGFDWTGDSLNANTNGAVSDSEPETTSTKKRKRKPEIKVDMTGDLDAYGPRSVSDFERQLLGQPNDSALWIKYMAFQLQLSDVQKARDIAERALRTFHIRETDEKANVWIAWLNLETAYGDDESLADVFKRACQVQDPLEMHEKLASIYIDAGKLDKADAHFETMVGNKNFRASPDVWLNYATFLLNNLIAKSRARALLPRALQSIQPNEHRLLTAKFAALEFHSQFGDTERGRTIFEGLVSEWPKWSSGWDMWVDLERGRISHEESDDGKDEARDKARKLYERMADGKMKKRRARFVFKRWLEFEEAEGSEKQVERVTALATEYVERLQAKGEEDAED